MDWMEEAAMRQKRGCQLLLSRDSECLQPVSYTHLTLPTKA